MKYDFIVVGAGIVGAATARQLLIDDPSLNVLLVDKEEAPARHQSGHNSGVIHAGVYYPPGSLKARLCRDGARATKYFCERQGIPVDSCGKLIVATSDLELQRLRQLEARSRDNGVLTEYLDAEALRALEPRLQGCAALRVPETAVVDFKLVCQALLQDFDHRGGVVKLGAEVQAIEERYREVSLQTSQGNFHTKRLICCAGLMADRLARLNGVDCPYRIIPFRGEFYRLHERCNDWFSHLVYPVPEPALPFLGVHLTRTPDGGLTAGPNALLGLHREAYRRADIRIADVADMLFFQGFWRLLWQYRRAGFYELMNAFSKERYLQLLQRYCPELAMTDLLERSAGVRAQAVAKNGSLIQDFLFLKSRNVLHVINAPSPAATSAMPIGQYIVKQLQL